MQLVRTFEGMYSREEAKKIRQQFWIMFGKRFPHKWMLYNTKIKDLVLKFSFEKNRALVSIDITHEDDLLRAFYWDKMLSLRNIMLSDVSPDLIFEENYVLDSGKVISRIFVYLDEVKINRQTDWPSVYTFFEREMRKLEVFFITYQDFIKDE